MSGTTSDSPASARSATGYSTWRLIAEQLRADISDGRLHRGDRLPSENALAETFGVNRHTVRRAIAALAADGLVEARRGSGVFVTGGSVHIHRIGVRTRLSTSLGGRASSTGRVLESAVEPASRIVARQLALPVDAAVVRVEAMSIVDGSPFALSTSWFDAERFPDIANALRRTSSVTASLRAAGVDDYVRASTTIAARHATTTESALLGADPGAIVLAVEAVDALPDGTPLQYLITRFSAQRARLDIDHAASAQ